MILDDRSVVGYLRGAGLLDARDEAIAEPAGDGNINWVRRVRAGDGRSWVVKQARAALEKFPEYAADPVRLSHEARYLEIARPCDDRGVLPAVVLFDEANRILVLEDCGDVPRMAEALLTGRDLDRELSEIARFLARVHAATAEPALAARFANDQMRRLHGDHIFALPFRENTFPLAPAVLDRARSMWGDAALVACADHWYERYLTPTGALVHADVQGTNILLADRGAVLLDAEIAHVGDPAFDLGTLVAHVHLPAIATGDLPRARTTTRAVLDAYGRERDVPAAFLSAVAAYAAIEMIRRTIGAARVAAVHDAAAALRCLDLAESILAGDTDIAG